MADTVTALRRGKAAAMVGCALVAGSFAVWVSLLWGFGTWENFADGRVGWGVVSGILSVAPAAVAVTAWQRADERRGWLWRLTNAAASSFIVALFLAFVAVLMTIP
jgi:hypothetical protein